MKKIHLEIFAQNDIHGRYFNTPQFQDGSRVSVARFSALLKERRLTCGADRVVAIDCGDTLQGDPAAFCLNRRFLQGLEKQGHVFPRIAGYLQLDAAVVGNHDIEAGKPVYDAIRDQLEERGIPYLAANAFDVPAGRGVSPRRKCHFRPYTILEKGGIRIAVIGFTSTGICRWLPRDRWEGIRFTEMEDIARTLVREIQERHAPHLTILAVHSGSGNGQRPVHGGKTSENQALWLASHVPGIDLVLAAHDHKRFCQNGPVPVMSASSLANQVQCATVELDFEGGKLLDKHIEAHILDMSQYEDDPEYLDFFRDDIRQVEEYSNEIIGSLECGLRTADAFTGPCDYVNLMHSVQLEATGAQISFAAPYAYNATIGKKDITRREMFLMHSCDNTLYKVKMTGRQIRGYLEQSYSRWVRKVDAENPHIYPIGKVFHKGRIYCWMKYNTFDFDSAAGIRYTVDISRDDGERIGISCLEDGTPFRMDGEYTVALSSYRISGGGDLFDKGAGLDPGKDLDRILLERYTYVRELMEDFIRRGKPIRKFRNWKFIPEKAAADAMANDLRLLHLL